jgi:hypothetical protein
VHRAAPVLRQGLGHERRVDAPAHRRLLHDQPVGHEVVGHRQRVGVAQVDLVLARSDLVVGVLDGDPHGLERLDDLPAEVRLDVERGEVEVAAVVERGRVVGPREQEELHLGVHVEGEAHVRPWRGCAQDLAGVGGERLPLRGPDVAEHPGDPGLVRAPRQHLEGEASGMASMSDSWTRANPSTAEPSKPIPSAKAPSISEEVIATDFSMPRTSVNHSRTNRMSRSSTVRSTYSCCLSTTPPDLRPIAADRSGTDGRSRDRTRSRLRDGPRSGVSARWCPPSPR